MVARDFDRDRWALTDFYAAATTRSRPPRLASYSASSACLITASMGASGSWATAAPTETLTPARSRQAVFESATRGTVRFIR
jgi:hypothetical protein